MPNSLKIGWAHMEQTTGIFPTEHSAVWSTSSGRLEKVTTKDPFTIELLSRCDGPLPVCAPVTYNNTTPYVLYVPQPLRLLRPVEILLNHSTSCPRDMRLILLHTILLHPSSPPPIFLPLLNDKSS